MAEKWLYTLLCHGWNFNDDNSGKIVLPPANSFTRNQHKIPLYYLFLFLLQLSTLTLRFILNRTAPFTAWLFLCIDKTSFHFINLCFCCCWVKLTLHWLNNNYLPCDLTLVTTGWRFCKTNWTYYTHSVRTVAGLFEWLLDSIA